MQRATHDNPLNILGMDKIKSDFPEAYEYLMSEEFLEDRVNLNSVDQVEAALERPMSLRSELSLSGLFIWAYTPQGREYWKNINDEVAPYGY